VLKILAGDYPFLPKGEFVPPFPLRLSLLFSPSQKVSNLFVMPDFSQKFSLFLESFLSVTFPLSSSFPFGTPSLPQRVRLAQNVLSGWCGCALTFSFLMSFLLYVMEELV